MAKKILAGFVMVLIIVTSIRLFNRESQPAPSTTKTLATERRQSSSDASTEASEVYDDLPVGSKEDPALILVNHNQPMKENTVLPITIMKNGYEIAEMAFDAYYALEQAAKEAGIDLTVVSAYRSVENQQNVYDNSIQEYMAQGKSEERARKLTDDYIAIPGTSEHHTGLALDVVDQDWYADEKGLEPEFGQTKAGKWLANNVTNYGFIIRYPKEKEEITGIQYEPWHIRYVGKEHAAYMKKYDLTLEQYIERFEEKEKNGTKKSDTKKVEKEGRSSK
ncbi:M15 family metallopeptidase [Vagococcus lutrae]|uniref:M15 family metallopeptidase n=1 Tax=Vagococcus lutrae TaxID=81947 RepID=UPI001C96B51E|nr:M15 family metallopeptidase [Vagococcus lutrae]QZN89291.1 M15 family metallopeptidase [Vagococcus lutrae]